MLLNIPPRSLKEKSMSMSEASEVKKEEATKAHDVHGPPPFVPASAHANRSAPFSIYSLQQARVG